MQHTYTSYTLCFLTSEAEAYISSCEDTAQLFDLASLSWKAVGPALTYYSILAVYSTFSRACDRPGALYKRVRF